MASMGDSPVKRQPHEGTGYWRETTTPASPATCRAGVVFTAAVGTSRYREESPWRTVVVGRNHCSRRPSVFLLLADPLLLRRRPSALASCLSWCRVPTQPSFRVVSGGNFPPQRRRGTVPRLSWVNERVSGRESISGGVNRTLIFSWAGIRTQVGVPPWFGPHSRPGMG
jgi:hypothetical protein